MKKNFKKFIALPLIMMSLASCNTNFGGGNYDGYYKSISKDDFGASLITNLHNLMVDTHKYYPTYSEFMGFIHNAKCDGSTQHLQGKAGDPTKVIYFYTGKETSYNKTNNTNREHVWPCANSSELWTHNAGAGKNYVDGSGYRGGGSDLFHIRMSDAGVNQGRQNYKFGYIPQGKGTVLTDGGPYKVRVDEASKICEVDDHFKGDIARILMYLYMHYTNAFGERPQSIAHYFGKLDFSNVVKGKNFTECKQILVDWNAIDPVDDDERVINDYVYCIQGNRNPFIDHEEFLPLCLEMEPSI